MSFALITGGSKGIGKCIAIELAKKGKDLVLIARDTTALHQTCSEISRQYTVQALYFVADLAEDHAPQNIFNWCVENSITIDVLVNNAGYGLTGSFEKYSLKEHLDMMQVNMDAVIQLSYLFLPVLREQQKSYIVNIASTAGLQAIPFMGLYAASKSFVRLFSRALHIELKETAVSVTCIVPGTTDTGFNKRAGVGQKALKLAKKFSMTPEKLAQIAVRSMYQQKTEVVVGFVNKLGAFIVWLLPKKIIEKSAAGIYRA